MYYGNRRSTTNSNNNRVDGWHYNGVEMHIPYGEINANGGIRCLNVYKDGRSSNNKRVELHIVCYNGVNINLVSTCGEIKELLNKCHVGELNMRFVGLDGHYARLLDAMED